VNRRGRNTVLLWIIALGLFNFVAYTAAYWYLGGDAPNGSFRDGNYFLRGHFIWSPSGKPTEPVSRAVWLYSYLHSISIWPTSAAVLVSMFILSQPHIIATMNADTPQRGFTYVVICITAIVMVTGVATLAFVLNFLDALALIANGRPVNI